MASGSRKSITGSFVSDGSSHDVRTPGFTPERVELYTSAGVSGVWVDSMAPGSVHKRLANGTGSQAASNGITPITNVGFTLGADAALNNSGDTVYWRAEE